MTRRSLLVWVSMAAVAQAAGTGCCWRPFLWRCGTGCCSPSFSTPPGAGTGPLAAHPYGGGFDGGAIAAGGPGCSSCYSSPAAGPQFAAAPVGYGGAGMPIATSVPGGYPVMSGPPVVSGPITVAPPGGVPMGSVPLPAPTPTGTK